MRNQIMLIAAAVTLASCIHASAQEDMPESRVMIQAYTDAYNQNDLDGMAVMMADDIRWLSVEGTDMPIYANGKVDLVAQMTDYFSRPRLSQSTLSGWGYSGMFTSVVETVGRTNDDGDFLSQSSIAIYQIEDGLIHTVWYFPAQ